MNEPLKEEGKETPVFQKEWLDTQLITYIINEEYANNKKELNIEEANRLDGVMGIYFIFDDEQLMYIGKTENLKGRLLNNHIYRFKKICHKPLFNFVNLCGLFNVPNSSEWRERLKPLLERAETFFIKKLKPPINSGKLNEYNSIMLSDLAIRILLFSYELDGMHEIDFETRQKIRKRLLPNGEEELRGLMHTFKRTGKGLTGRVYTISKEAGGRVEI